MLPQLSYVARRLIRRSLPLAAAAARTWVVHPGQRALRSRAYFLEGQLDRVEGVQEETTRDVEEGRVLGSPVEHAPTRAHELRDAVLVRGSVYSRGTRLTLFPGSALPSVLRSPREEVEQAALDCTFVGNRYFGHWLTDDCPLNLLAREYAPPLGVARPPYPQEAGYFELWQLSTLKVDSMRVRSLLVFQDFGQNDGKRARYVALRTRLARCARSLQPRGVYLRRGTSGVRRVLTNEREIEERLVARGFELLDPAVASPTLVAQACAGAPCIASVEGSALAHGVMNVADGGAIVALQPPWRFNNAFKDYADCLGLRYGFVVGRRTEGGFRIDPDELERTLDLCDRG